MVMMMVRMMMEATTPPGMSDEKIMRGGELLESS